MNTAIALVSHSSIVTSQREAAAMMVGDSSPYEIMGMMIEAGKAQEQREKQFQRALKGEFITVSAVGKKLFEDYGLKITTPQLNNTLVDMNLQIRERKSGDFQNKYFTTDMCRDLGAGQNHRTGDVFSVKWDVGVVSLIADFLTSPEVVDEQP